MKSELKHGERTIRRQRQDENRGSVAKNSCCENCPEISQEKQTESNVDERDLGSEKVHLHVQMSMLSVAFTVSAVG